MVRTETLFARLARWGFGDPSAYAPIAEDWAATLGEPRWTMLLEELAAAADPDLAFNGLARVAAARPELIAELAADQTWTRRLARVLGASIALSQHLGLHPEEADLLAGDIAQRTPAELRDELLAAIAAQGEIPVADPARAADLRRAYRRALLRITARDLTAADAMAVLPEIATELADLADATVEAALALARGEVEGWELARLGVIALGKTGARELNYVSDVDLLYLAEPALDAEGNPVCDTEQAIRVATKVVGAMVRVCSAQTVTGTIWQVDSALRPEGKAGPLVRTLASHRAYYERWAKNWEFQAMLKARPMAGDLGLAQEFVDMVWPMVWRVADDDQFVAESQAMRRRVVSLLPATQADHEIKLGAGGLRDVEFSVQLLQLVHGRGDERLRLRGTFEALDALVALGYVGRTDGHDLNIAYRLQRLLEHRLQLRKLRRTHLMPTDETNQRWLSRSLGLSDPKDLTHLWRRSTRRVLTLHQRLFYSPLLEAVARIPSSEVRLTSEGAEIRLRALGYGDPKAALRHIEALSTGMSRRAEIQRQLLPAMLGWFTSGPNPDHGLLAFRQVSDALGTTPWYLRTLRDEGTIAEHFAKVLASSRYAVDLLLRNPQSAAWLSESDGLTPRSGEAVLAEMRAAAGRYEAQSEAVAALRAVRRSELLRLAMADILNALDVGTLGHALSELASATIEATIEVAGRELSGVPRLAVIALGRWGGEELSYASDADGMIVIGSEDPAAAQVATTLIGRVRTMLAQPGADPALQLDLDLRPEGKGGPMVRSLASYTAYYRRWSSTWEAQALLRAQVGAGDRELGERLLAEVEQLRYPAEGISNAQVVEIRKLKARMENERMGRGSDPRRNLKLGPGGLSDVEWVVQLMQLRHAGAYPALRTPYTVGALRAAERLQLIEPDDADALADGWVFAARIRNAIMLSRGRASDTIPTDIRELSAVAQILGYGKGESSLLVEDWQRRARLARQVMDRLFWDLRG